MKTSRLVFVLATLFCGFSAFASEKAITDQVLSEHLKTTEGEIARFEKLNLLGQPVLKDPASLDAESALLRVMTGINVRITNFQKFAEKKKNRIKNRIYKQNVVVVLSLLKDRHDIYREIYIRQTKKIRTTPAVSFESRLRANFAQLRAVQDSFVRSVAEMNEVKDAPEKAVTLRQRFDVMNMFEDEYLILLETLARLQ